MIKSQAKLAFADVKYYWREHWYVLILFYLSSNFGKLSLFWGEGEESVTYKVLDVVGVLIYFVVVSVCAPRILEFIKTQKLRPIHGEDFFNIPTFILKNFYYSLIVLVGVLLLILPGVYFYFAFYFAQFVAIFDHQELHPFKKAKLLFERNKKAVIVLGIVNLLMEGLGLWTNLLPDYSLKLTADCLFGIVDAFVGLWFLHLTIRIYSELSADSIHT